MMETVYNPQRIEAKWQARWAERDPYQTRSNRGGPSFYCLSAIQDPGPNGLTIGHLRSYIASDVLARFKSMQGYNVLHPIAWDTFSLPVERAAEERNQPYRVIVDEYVTHARRQLIQVGVSFDTEQEFCTSDPDYYRWTQWGFLHLYKLGLLYQGPGMAYFCNTCNRERTNTELHDGHCANCEGAIEVKFYPQWFVSLASMAPRLEKKLSSLRWPAEVVRTQYAWLGHRDGYIVNMGIPGCTTLAVFIEQIEWLDDLTFIAVDIGSTVARTLVTSDLLETLQSELAGIHPYHLKHGHVVAAYSRHHAIHPLDGRPIPILITTDGRPPSGLGARAGVPRWSASDAMLAHRCGVPTCSHTSSDVPGHYTRLLTEHIVYPVVRYQVRDWRISRRRHWGAPVPMVNCPRCGIVPHREDQLPVFVREAPGDFSGPVRCPQCRGPAEADLSIISPFACISWYFIRAASAACTEAPTSHSATSPLPVDIYVGATRYATLHLLLARMWTHIWYDAAIINSEEPFKWVLPYGTIAGSDGRRMSRAHGNVVWVHEALTKAGADALRIALLQLGSLESNVRWEPHALQRASRFLQEIWRLVTTDFEPRQKVTLHVGQAQEQCRMAHQAVTQALEGGRFHLALAALARLARRLRGLLQDGAISFVEWETSIDHLIRLMAPFTPYICAELWALRGHDGDVYTSTWDEYKEGSA